MPSCSTPVCSKQSPCNICSLCLDEIVALVTTYIEAAEIDRVIEEFKGLIRTSAMGDYADAVIEQRIAELQVQKAVLGDKHA